MKKTFNVVGKIVRFAGNKAEPYTACRHTLVFDTMDMTLKLDAVIYRYDGFSRMDTDNVILRAVEYWGDERVLMLELHTDYPEKQCDADPEWDMLVDAILDDAVKGG